MRLNFELSLCAMKSKLLFSLAGGVGRFHPGASFPTTPRWENKCGNATLLIRNNNIYYHMHDH